MNQNEMVGNATNFNDYATKKVINFETTPIVDIVNYILITASKKNASDIHFDPADNHMKVRFRIDGKLDTFTIVPNSAKQNLIARLKIMSGMNITETRLPQDGAIRTVIEGISLDMRVSSLPTKRGEKIVIRIMDYSMSLKGLESLCFNDVNYKKVLKMISEPNGIILVTGATGSGKSTTVYSLLQRLNTEDTNLITVEDPVEMELDGMNQVQVNSEIGLTFATVLRSILRQDPNVIMIGEIRDSETAQIAVRASITGHLVLSTIHTNNSLSTIERLLDMDVERYLLASALEGIISQKLARRLCDKCKKLRPTNNYEKNLFRTILGLEVGQVYEPVGCPECSFGFKGRVALHEVLLINQDIRDAISNNVSKENLRKLVYSKDVITMIQDGFYKILAGFTTITEVLKLIDLDDEIEERK
ncbi:MAG: GspE/PulE family protein [Erysipelotrichaceae bacterium]|nr:GspE/PulE family protein [Erysipelotrichaceae bacterium]